MRFYPGRGAWFTPPRIPSSSAQGLKTEISMPVNVVKTPEDEKKWNRAKARAAEEGHSEDWAYVMSIYQSMKGNKKSMKKSAFLSGYLYG